MARGLFAGIILGLAGLSLWAVLDALRMPHPAIAPIGLVLVIALTAIALWTVFGDHRRLSNVAARSEEFVVICIIVPEGIDENVAAVINEKMNSFDPDNWELYLPSAYKFFFRKSARGDERAANAINLLLTTKSLNSRLEKMRIGKASGRLLALFSKDGNVLTTPLGGASNDAAANAA